MTLQEAKAGILISAYIQDVILLEADENVKISEKKKYTW